MSQFCNYILLIGITISITHINGNERGGRPRTIAMKAIFLNNYCKQVATHGYHKVDETKQTEFMDTWEHVLGQENAKQMLQTLEVHWMYSVNIVSKPIPDLTALIVTIVVRIMALQDGLSYLMCVVYYEQAEIGVTPEHCRKRAAYLIIFSQLHILSLVSRLWKTRLYIRGFNCTLPDWFNLLTILTDWKKVTPMLQEILTTNIQPGHKKSENALNFETIESTDMYNTTIKQLVTHGIHNLLNNVTEETLFLIMFGMMGCKFSYLKGNIFFQWRKKIVISMWNNALKIDTSSFLEDKGNMEKYFITDLIRENIVWRSEVNKLSRRNFIEQFEIMKPDELEIWYEGNKFNNTVLSMTSDTF